MIKKDPFLENLQLRTGSSGVLQQKYLFVFFTNKPVVLPDDRPCF